MDNSTVILNIIILGLGRFLDLLSTWYGSPNLDLEMNSWMRKVGWKGVILINVAFILIFPFIMQERSFIFAILSALFALRNFQMSTIARALGEESYRKIYGKYVANSPWHIFLLPVFFESLVYVAIGFAIFMIIGNNKTPNFAYINKIGVALFVFGFITFFVNVANKLEWILSRKDKII